MSPEAQRIAIAEACGYEIGDMSSIRAKPMPSIVGKDGKHWQPHEYAKLPDYPSDLNAMHEAEKVLTLDQYYKYSGRLLGKIGGLSATAAQRAEAFLRTLGLWKE